MLLLGIVLLFSTSLVAKYHDMSEGHSFISCSIRPCDRPSGKRPSPRLSLGKQAAASSTNWSGYVAAPNLSKPVIYSVSEVSGSWIVPSVQSMGYDTWCSIWVGIDGSVSPSVEQIGTEHDIKNGVQSHYAWYEMYPLGSNEIVGFPVEVGDQISASVTYIALGGNVLQPNCDLFILQIFNNTKKLYTSIPYITTTRMQRVCAEWVVEAPYLNEILPLSNFGIAYLSNCSAVISNYIGAINSSLWQNESMDMVSASGVEKAITSDLSADGKSFSVAWKSS